MWDRRLPGADAALSIRPARGQQRRDACMEGELEVKHGQRLQRVNKRSFLEVGVKVHLLWLDDPRSRADTRAARPPNFFTLRA